MITNAKKIKEKSKECFFCNHVLNDLALTA